MGAKDISRQQPNVMRMQLLGAEIKPVERGTASLKDALNEALRDWVAHVNDTFYVIGTVAGPHPYPMMVRDFQAIIGQELKTQIIDAEGRLPDTIVACIGGGSNAMGIFHPFLDDQNVSLIGVEAGGKGLESEHHAASIGKGSPAILHGNLTYFLQNSEGQIKDADSISAGLDYPGIGPEHAFLAETGRASYVSATDDEALNALALCSRLEGIIPALEPAHALAYVTHYAASCPENTVICLNLCGRGDKDMDTISSYPHLFPS
jgi:tryptophan synthase beta chain